MDQNLSFTQNIDVLFSNLEDFSKNEGVMGKPMTYGDKTLVPIVSVTLGYGSGNTPGKNQQNAGATNQGTGAGMGITGMGAIGLGARINTEAIVVIDKDNVQMLPVNQSTNLNQMMDKIPQMLMNMNQNKQQNQNQNQQQGQQGQDQQQNQQ